MYAKSNSSYSDYFFYTNSGGLCKEGLLFDIYVKNDALWDEHIKGLESKEDEAIDNLKTDMLKNLLKGKQLSVLGDSISTFSGVSNDASEGLSDNAVFYSSQIARADTYWQQIIDDFGMELCVNNSWSGAYASMHKPNVNANKDSDGSVSSGMARANKLAKSDGTSPDYILVYIGINDLNAGVAADVIASSYTQMLMSMSEAYPYAKVFCLNMPNRNVGNSPIAYNTAIANAIESVNEARNKENIFLVDLYNSALCGGTYKTYSLDNLHPNAVGMDYMSEVIIDTMKEKMVNRRTASAPTYKDLQKFSYFADENGKKVSTQNPYTYTSGAEVTLTAVYENFVDVAIQVNTSGKSAWYAESKKYKSENWFDLGYLTEPLTQGMSVSFEFYTSGMVLFGVSPLERIENSMNYGWGTSYPKLFVPEINYYSSTEDTSFELYQRTDSAHGGKISYKYASLKTGYHTAKIVMADKVLIYVDNVLTNGEGKEYDTSKQYYLSLSGSGPTYQFTEFGMDKDSKQVFVSNPIEEEEFVGKKITFLGDSITQGVGSNFTSSSQRYSSVLCSELSAVESNMGISGTVLCTGHESRASRLGDVDKIALDSDYVFVMLGTNDFDNAKTGFAELGEKGSTDTSTVYGAINVLCQKLVNRFGETNTKIYLVTPIPVQNSLDSTLKNANGWSLLDWSEVLIETAKEYGLNYIDLNLECEFTASDMANTLHPNTSGTAKMVAVLKAHLLANESYYTPYTVD